jgi:hypothetical protein
MNEAMNGAMNGIDHAAAQSDRWLFITLLFIVIVAMVVVWRWIISDREKISNRLTAMTDRHIAVTEKLSEVVSNNTAVLHQVEKKL